MAIRLLSSENITGNITVSGTGTFAGTVLIDGVLNYTGLTVKGSGASRPFVQFTNATQGALGGIGGTEGNDLILTSGASGAIALTLDSSQNATFAGSITCNNVATDKKIAFRRTGGNNFSIEHDSSSIYFYNETTASVVFKMANNNNATFAGNVGIGGSPTFKLDVLTNGSSLRLNSSDANGAYITWSNNGTAKGQMGSAYHLFASPYNLNTDIAILAVGGLGISTNGAGSPALYLNTSGNATFAGDVTINGKTTFNIDVDSKFTIEDAGTNAVYMRAGTSDEVYFGANNNYQLRLKTNKDVVMDNGGNFGIGTGSPANKLEVVETTANTDVVVNIKATRDAYLQFSPANTTKWALIADYPAVGDFTTYNYPSNFNSIICKSNKDITTNLSGGNFGIGTTAPGEKLEVNGGAYINGRDIGKGVNLATSQGWTVLSAGNVNSVLGYFGGNFNRNGASNENEIIWGTNHADQRSLIWKSTNNDTGSNDDGGWNKGIQTRNDNMGYMSYVYVKRTNASTNGSFYFGCNGGNTLNLAGSAIGNPYFQSVNIGTLPLNVWCLAIGHIQANNDSNTTNNPDTGIYRLDTGVKVAGGTSFKMGNNGGDQTHRTYLYYSTDPVSTLSWVDPGFYAIDGTQPTMAELFDTGTPSAGGSSPWTTSGNDIYYTTGEVGINNTTPGSFPSDHNQLVVGSGNGRQGLTIYSGNDNNGEGIIDFTDNTNNYSNNYQIKVLHADNDSNGNPAFYINNEFNAFFKITKQTNNSQYPKIKMGPSFSGVPTQDNLDESILTIPIPTDLNNPGLCIFGNNNGNSNPYVGIKHTGNSNYDNPRFMKFYNYQGSTIGYISQVFNSNSISYNTSSDYRLKDDLKPFKALDTVSKIKVYNYHWKDFDEKARGYGALAHELQELIPEAVQGKKDETNDDGTIEVQSVDYSKIVPHLIQSIQDLKAELDKLKKQIL